MASRHRPEDEGEINPGDRCEGVSDYVGNARGLAGDPSKLIENWAIRIRLKPSAVTVSPVEDDPGRQQGVGFLAQHRWRNLGRPGQFAQMP